MSLTLRYALVGDGPTDRVLHHVIDWSIREAYPAAVVREPGFVPRGGADLGDTIREARRRHAPDLVIVHRDAEREDPRNRWAEIAAADADATPIVPVRMTETWLLIDEPALRRAAGHPLGRADLALPAAQRLESAADPKEILRKALFEAAEITGQRKKRRFTRELSARIDRLGALIRDYSPLRRLPAFREFETCLRASLEKIVGSD